MQDAQSLIEVKRAVLHILDLNSGVPVFSDELLDRGIFAETFGESLEGRRSARQPHWGNQPGAGEAGRISKQ